MIGKRKKGVRIQESGVRREKPYSDLCILTPGSYFHPLNPVKKAFIILALAGLFPLYSFLFQPYCLAQDTPQFTYRITDFQPMSTAYGRVKGVVTNNNDADFREVIFNLVVYNEQGVVLGQVRFSLRNLTSGQTKQFATTIKAKHKSIDHYRIDFISGTTFKRPD